MNYSAAPWEDWRTLQQKRGAQFTTSSQEPLKADYETPGPQSWATGWPQFHGLFLRELHQVLTRERAPPGSGTRKESVILVKYIQSRSMTKANLMRKSWGEGLGSHFNPSSLLVSTKKEVMGDKHL